MSPTFRSIKPISALGQWTLERDVLKRGVPRHVAVIQDGNRRYARAKRISSLNGHLLGSKTTEKVADWCLDLGIKYLTVYAFSTENFDRPEEEKSYLFGLIKDKLLELSTSERIHKSRIRVKAVGRTELLPEFLQDAIGVVEDATCDYDRVYFNIALAYGGKREILDVARALAIKVKAGQIRPEDVNEAAISRHLYPEDDVSLPDVDLMIRTGGEHRTSNFLPWQSNGNECPIYICKSYWPEFGKVEFLRAIRCAQILKVKKPIQFGFNGTKRPSCNPKLSDEEGQIGL